ncbi:DBF4-type zinc finger-containing protein 2 homolog [Triticum urartu]|uniref:DBF4-type zinc finger-containing protein 2 homolog n=1 Tax=Triticum urartu TaxID=4572 RepID=UPI00204339A7|nr:DBF4-type zinc finger-containing protein 2 homolog [Triticum urartu]
MDLELASSRPSSPDSAATSPETSAAPPLPQRRISSPAPRSPLPLSAFFLFPILKLSPCPVLNRETKEAPWPELGLEVPSPSSAAAARLPCPLVAGTPRRSRSIPPRHEARCPPPVMFLARNRDLRLRPFPCRLPGNSALLPPLRCFSCPSSSSPAVGDPSHQAAAASISRHCAFAKPRHRALLPLL